MEDLESVSRSILSMSSGNKIERCFKVSCDTGFGDEILVLKKDATQVFYSYFENAFISVSGDNEKCLEFDSSVGYMHIKGPRVWFKGKRKMTIYKALDERKKCGDHYSLKGLEGDSLAMRIIELMTLDEWEKIEDK